MEGREGVWKEGREGGEGEFQINDVCCRDAVRYFTGIFAHFIQYELVMRPNKLRNDLDFRPKIFKKKQILTQHFVHVIFYSTSFFNVICIINISG